MPIGAFRLTTISAASTVSGSYWYNILSASGVGDRALKSAVDSTGNIYIVGQYSANEQGLVFKFNSNGVIQWQKAMAANYVLRDIALDSTGNIYVCGGDESASPAKPWLVKLNPADGTIAWQKNHSSDLAFSNEFYAMTIDASNNIELVGRNNLSTGHYAGTYCRYTTAGVKSTSYSQTPTTSYPEHLCVSQSSANNTSVRYAGEMLQSGNTYAIVASRQIGTSGTYFYSRLSTALATSTNNTIFDMEYDPVGQGQYCVGGTYESAAAQVLVLKMASGSTAAVTWARYINVPTYATSCCLNGSNNQLYVTYNSGNIGYIISFNSSGTLLWTKSITASTGYIRLYGIVWNNGALHITGETTVNAGVIDPIIWKLPDDGSKTGTYGNFTYATATNPTVTTYTPTFTAITKTGANRTNTTADTTTTPSTTTMTSTTTTVV